MGHFPLCWRVSIVKMQTESKEVLPAGSTVVRPVLLILAWSSVKFLRSSCIEPQLSYIKKDILQWSTYNDKIDSAVLVVLEGHFSEILHQEIKAHTLVCLTKFWFKLPKFSIQFLDFHVSFLLFTTGLDFLERRNICVRGIQSNKKDDTK